MFYGNNSRLSVSLLLYGGQTSSLERCDGHLFDLLSEFALSTCYMLFVAIVLFRQLVVSYNLNYRIIGEP